MIKDLLKVFLKYKIWLSVVIALNLIFALLLWLIDSESFRYILGTIIISSILIYVITGFLIYNLEKRKVELFKEFLENPSLEQESLCLNVTSGFDKEFIKLIGDKLRDKDREIKKHELNLKEYENYIETWAHEIKTPLALMNFVLDNRKEDIPDKIHSRLEYTRTKMQEDVERMLYYTRVKSNHLDYLFKKIYLRDICEEIIEEYKSLITEQNIIVNNKVEDIQIFSDQKSLLFILRQILSNSIKYMDKKKSESVIDFITDTDEITEEIILKIRDNGIGVKSYDLPFLFDKGFTGDAGEYRKKSTGVGLYLAKEVSNNLKIKIEISELYNEGFEIIIRFPQNV